MLTDGKLVIDYTRVADGFQFDTHRLRCQYLGKTAREKPRFLEEHRGQFERVEDVLREFAQPPDDIEAARTELIFSPDTRNEGDDHHNSLARCSPPCQPESVPAPENGNVPSGSTQTELAPVETGRKQGRVGRQRKKRRLSAKVWKARRKLMLAVLEYLPECPVLSNAARKAGIHRKKLEYWINRSKAGDDGYDFECDALMLRFHELVEFAIEEANDKVDEAAWKLAMGELYKNEDGREVPHLYVRRPNGKMMRFLLERKFPEKYGKHPKVDVPQQGGVVLIGTPMKPKKTCAAASIKARQWKALSRRLRDAKD
jgi:hypothetical protein